MFSEGLLLFALTISSVPFNPGIFITTSFNLAILAKLATLTSEIPQNAAVEYIVTFPQIRFFSCKCHF